MIQIENMTKAFGDRVLFHEYNQTIEDGEFIIFSGVSGCGKTTLLNIIGGIEPAGSGSIKVDGIDITLKKNLLLYFRTKVGFLFQNFALVENKTVKQNLEMVNKKYRTEVTIEKALEKVGLSELINEKIYTLSGGEQQRVALARLMIKKCDVILADEPTGSLDKQNADEVMAILTGLNRQGKTVILVTHDEAIKKMGGRVIEL